MEKAERLRQPPLHRSIRNLGKQEKDNLPLRSCVPAFLIRYFYNYKATETAASTPADQLGI